MKAIQKGFTLIELMIVVAIIGILAAVAIPQYQDYTKKAKIGNALTSVDSVKTAVGLCAQESGLTNCDSGSNGVPAAADFTPTKEVASMAAIDNGVIEITLGTGIGGTLDGKKLTFTPTSAAGSTSLTWQVCPSFTDSAEPAAYAAVTKNNKTACGAGGAGTGT